MNTYRFEIQNVVLCLSVDGDDEADARARLRRVLDSAVDGLTVIVPGEDEVDDGGGREGAVYIEDSHGAAKTALVLDTEEDEETDP